MASATGRTPVSASGRYGVSSPIADPTSAGPSKAASVTATVDAATTSTRTARIGGPVLPKAARKPAAAASTAGTVAGVLEASTGTTAPTRHLWSGVAPTPGTVTEGRRRVATATTGPPVATRPTGHASAFAEGAVGAVTLAEIKDVRNGIGVTRCGTPQNVCITKCDALLHARPYYPLVLCAEVGAT